LQCPFLLVQFIVSGASNIVMPDDDFNFLFFNHTGFNQPFHIAAFVFSGGKSNLAGSVCSLCPICFDNSHEPHDGAIGLLLNSNSAEDSLDKQLYVFAFVHSPFKGDLLVHADI
jgi:hypothetical protein